MRYYPTHYISNHALERFRQWTNGTFAAMDDEELIQRIDEALTRGTKEKAYETIVDTGKSMRLYDLKKFMGNVTVYALVGANLPEYQDKHKEAVLSILTAENVERSRTNGRWVVPFNSFGSKLSAALELRPVVPSHPAPIWVAPPAVDPIAAAGAAHAQAMLVAKNQKKVVAQLERDLADARLGLQKADQEVMDTRERLEQAVEEA